MNRVLIKNIVAGQVCRISGFVENIRDGKTMGFLVIKDISGKLQVTIEKGANPALDAVFAELTADSVVDISGMVNANDFVQMGGIEMLPDSIAILSPADALPIVRREIPGTKKRKAVERSSIDQRLDYRWIDLRTDENHLMMRVQTLIQSALRDFLIGENFIEIHSPKLIGSASESGSEVFALDYYDTKAYLAQSPQFYKQMAMAAGLERVFEIGPVFRAEKSHTNRHATEYMSIDLEMSYIDSYRDVIELKSRMLVHVFQAVKDAYGDEISALFDKEIIVPALPFPIVTLPDLLKGLADEFGYAQPIEDAGNLSTEAEQLSFQWVQKHYNHEFLYVTDFGAEKRAFYHMRENGIPQGFDLIWRGVEITTGAQREHRYAPLKAQADEIGLGADVQYYLDFFRYGCPPHGGFAIGLERLSMLMLGMTIKEAAFLFRGPTRLTP